MTLLADPRDANAATFPSLKNSRTVVPMTTAIVSLPSLRHALQRPQVQRREISTRPVSCDATRWSGLGNMSASDAADHLLFVSEQASLPRHEALDGATIAYPRVDHAQIALHHHDQILSRRKPPESELDLVWIPTDDIDVKLMERSGRPVSVTYDHAGKMCGMSPKDGRSLPFNRDLVRVVEHTLGYEVDSAGHWPLVAEFHQCGSLSIIPAAQRDFGIMHLVLGKERLRTLDLTRVQETMARPLEEMKRARLLGYDAVTFRDHLVSGAHGIQAVTAMALFPESRAKLSHVTVPAHAYDWPEAGPTTATLTPEFLAWHQRVLPQAVI